MIAGAATAEAPGRQVAAVLSSAPARRLGRGLLIAAAAIGVLALAGWTSGHLWLAGDVSGAVTMRPATAVLLVVVAAAGGLGRPRPAAIGGGLVCAVAVVMLVEELAGRSTGLDRLLFPGALHAAGVDGRMSPNTAVGLALAGLATALPRANRLGQLCLFVTPAIGLVGVVGYVVNVSALHDIRGYSDMSLPTAVSLLLVATGLTALRPSLLAHRALSGETTAARLNRITLPLVVIVPVALAGIMYRSQASPVSLHVAAIAVIGGAVVVLAAVVLAAGAWQVTQEREVRRLQNAISAMLELAPEAIVGVAGDGRIGLANRRAEQLFGYPPGGMAGEPAGSLLPAGDTAGAEARRRDGSAFPCEVSRSLIDTQAGPITMTVVRDRTEELRIRNELAELERHRTEVIAQLVRAGEEERARIATELHDDTVQVLAAALIMADRLATGASGELTERIAELRRMLAAASERTRRMTFDLRPQVLEASGLGEAVELLATEVRRELPDLTVEVSVTGSRHPELVEQIAYRAVQEAVRNVRRHSRARRLVIRVWPADGALWGEVTDDGRGFEPAGPSAEAHLHLGIDGTRERLRLAGGDLELESAPQAGTTFRFHLPTT